MVGGGAAALAVRSPRPRLAYLAVGQLGWVAAGLATHFRSGTAASLFLLGAFAVAATCGPALLGRAEGGEPAIAGFGSVRPVRAAGLALAMLSLAGAPPLAGFFGELAVAASLAQSGNFALLGVGLLGSVISVAAPGRAQEAPSGSCSSPWPPSHQATLAPLADARVAHGPDRHLGGRTGRHGHHDRHRRLLRG